MLVKVMMLKFDRDETTDAVSAEMDIVVVIFGMGPGEEHAPPSVPLLQTYNPVTDEPSTVKPSWRMTYRQQVSQEMHYSLKRRV